MEVKLVMIKLQNYHNHQKEVVFNIWNAQQDYIHHQITNFLAQYNHENNYHIVQATLMIKFTSGKKKG